MSAPILHRAREMQYFLTLDANEQRAAIQKLASAGMSVTGISAATMLSIEQIGKILGEQRTKGEASP